MIKTTSRDQNAGRGDRMAGRGLVTSRRLGDQYLRGLEVILQILRLGGHFCGDHGASTPPPSCPRSPLEGAKKYFHCPHNKMSSCAPA